MKSSEFGRGFWVNVPLEHLKNSDQIFAAFFVVRVVSFDQKIDVGQQVRTADGKQEFSKVSLIPWRDKEFGNNVRIAEVALFVPFLHSAKHLLEEKAYPESKGSESGL